MPRSVSGTLHSNGLQRAYDERYGPLVFLRVDPDLDGVRDDPRFNTLVYQIFTRSAGAR